MIVAQSDHASPSEQDTTRTRATEWLKPTQVVGDSGARARQRLPRERRRREEDPCQRSALNAGRSRVAEERERRTSWRKRAVHPPDTTDTAQVRERACSQVEEIFSKPRKPTSVPHCGERQGRALQEGPIDTNNGTMTLSWTSSTTHHASHTPAPPLLLSSPLFSPLLSSPCCRLQHTRRRQQHYRYQSTFCLKCDCFSVLILFSRVPNGRTAVPNASLAPPCGSRGTGTRG